MNFLQKGSIRNITCESIISTELTRILIYLVVIMPHTHIFAIRILEGKKIIFRQDVKRIARSQLKLNVGNKYFNINTLVYTFRRL